MPTFCRHNRFVERCPICSRTLPEHAPSARKGAAKGSSRRDAGGRAPARSRSRAVGVRVRQETRAVDDGFRSELVPGLRASADAARLAQEIAFSSARLLALAAEPPGLYGEVRALAHEDLERATWACFLIAYLSPLEGDDPFAGIRLALAAAPARGAPSWSGTGMEDGLPDLAEIPLGPRTSHDPARGSETLIAYAQWVERGGTATAPHPGSERRPDATQAQAFTGDPAWSPERRFERLFERLALPGFGRMGRYELLVTLGRLGLYGLRPDSLHLSSARGLSGEDPATLAAKRVFGIGDPLLLERRAAALADAARVPVEALDLALANWAAPERATLGFPHAAGEEAVQERAEEALGL
jgi:hypothetical protein